MSGWSARSKGLAGVSGRLRVLVSSLEALGAEVVELGSAVERGALFAESRLAKAGSV